MPKRDDYHVAAESFLWEGWGDVLRDQGIEKVSANNGDWLSDCMRCFEFFPYHGNCKTFTGEDVRLFFEKRELKPSSPNAWGALIRTMEKRGMIRKTGGYRKMRDPNSHARMTAVYQRA